MPSIEPRDYPWHQLACIFLRFKRETALGVTLWLRGLLKRELLRRGAILSRPPGQFNIGFYKLRAAKVRGLDIRSAIDGGAATGGWARALKQIYPDARILCVEPRTDAQPALRQLASQLSGIDIADVLLGPREGQVTYHESEDQSSVLPDGEGKPFGRPVTANMSTLDRLIEQTALPGPDLIKLDLQGYELEALRGGPKALEKAQAVLLEVSFIRLQSSAPIAHEVIAFMQQSGFVIYDILALWHRPLDGALAQGDFLFLKQTHPLLEDSSWGSET